MDLEHYVASLRSQLVAATEAGGEGTRLVAEQLSTALEPAARLVLLELLSDAAGEVTRELAPGSVEVRLRGREPELVVSRADAGRSRAEPGSGPAPPSAPLVAADGLDDTATSRTTLRLPDSLKARVERAASSSGLSVNAWLVQAIAAALEPRNEPVGRRGRQTGDSFVGWVH
jgi:hypothetical protein